MIDTTLLKSFGMSEYETKVYCALSQFSSAKASDIARLSEVPPNKVYECLIRLAERGFVASLNVTPRKFRVTGTQVFENQLSKKEHEINELRKNVNSLRLALDNRAIDLQDTAIVLKGKKQIIQMLNQQMINLTAIRQLK